MHFSLLALLLATPTLGFSPLVPLHPPLPPPSHLFSTPQGGPDTLNAFSHDCATAVNARLDIDPTLPSFTVNRKRFVPDYQHLWTSKEWDQHISRWRYWSHMVHLPHSRIMKRTFPITTAIMAWSALALNFNKYIPFVLPRAPLLAIPLPAITLFSSFVTLLLTYRTNQSLSRILEGRLAWGRTVLLTRDTAQLLAAYIYKADKRYGLLAARHLSLFGWLLKCRLRDEDDGDLINGMLNPVDAQYVSQQRKHPVAIITVVRQIVSKCAVEGKINYAAQMSLEGNLLELNRVYGMCERIKMSPIPPMYTRHTSRVLMFWLFSLPLALQSLMRNIPSVMLITFCASYVTLGLDEISMQLEQPFRLMPMQPLAAAVMRDVADAFVCQPPELGVEEEGEEFEKPGYWPK